MATVVVIGGGYGGVTAARSLDAVADVILVEQKDQFVHHAAAFKAAVDREWADQIFLPYQSLLANGQVRQGTVLKLEGNRVHIVGQDPIDADYIVVATGSTYPFPAKHMNSSTAISRFQLDQLHEDLRGANRVLFVGGGPVGLEMAGAMRSAFPRLEIMILEQEEKILSDDSYANEFREVIVQQLRELNIELLTGEPLMALPPIQPAILSHFEVQTIRGRILEADMWFQCYGTMPATGFMRTSDYREALNPNGTIRVLPTMQVVGRERVYAIGDVTDILEPKRADAARRHARVAVSNIAAQISGQEPTHTYKPSINWMILPLGDNHGASQLVIDKSSPKIVGADQTAEIKGENLMLSLVKKQLNLQ